MKRNREYLVVQDDLHVFTMSIDEIGKCLSNESDIKLVKVDEKGALYTEESLAEDSFWDMVE